MNKLTYILGIAILSVTATFAQKKSDVLMTINDQKVTVKEFEQVYRKNLDLVQDENQKSVDGYLDLFVDYKLKVAEAYKQKLNERTSYVKDFSKYEEQLSRNYLYEEQVTADLIQEAFDRSRQEVDASHVLILCNFDALPQDTLVAYNKIKDIKAKVSLGEDFSKLATDFSEEPGVDKSKGRLGYFSAFALVYPFETMAYNTPVGQVSDIVRTQYGYHIIKVHDKREKAPQVRVAHIMASSRDGNEAKAKERITEIDALLKQGQSFEDLAKQYSDDKATGVKGGEMRAFSRGGLKAPAFEDAAYSLQKPGDVSKPIKTRFGWHIVKLIELLKMPTFEEAKPALEQKVRSTDRSKIITNAVNVQLKEKVQYKKVEDLSFFETFVGDDVMDRKWEFTEIPKGQDKVLFSMETEKVYYSDFAKYIANRQSKARPYKQKTTLLKAYYDEFETIKLKENFRKNLEATNDEYATVIREYRDGLLIFEVMGDNVWNKAKQDTLGQEAFFLKNQGNYQWKKRIEADILSATTMAEAKTVQAMLNGGTDAAGIKKSMNVNDKVAVVVTSETFEIGDSRLPSNTEWRVGVSDIIEDNKSFVVVNVKKQLPAGPKTRDDVKGKVLSDFQAQVEKDWMQSLRDSYKVTMNKKALKKLKKKLD
ncbi:MAG: peptidylprolyl isomerase [Bacteroidetes bacterium]|nr:peptidylprolyl isomerase [Bacteroidota bacterium]